jgi:hypothetical protein
MTRFTRWCVVALAVGLVVGVPIVLRTIPAGGSDVTATVLLDRVKASADHPWSGYAETEGSLDLPVTDDFEDVGALFSDGTRMRAWWRGSDDWRVDRLLVSGETDLVHQHGLTLEWSYEDEKARLSRDPGIRLPRTADLLPPVLAERLLRDADADAVRRIDSRRIAGISAPGLQVEPSAPQSSIDHVDLWADPDSGVPLRVEVYGEGASSPAFVSELRSFSATTPSPDDTDFDAGPGTEIEHEDVLDIADAANQYAPLRPPKQVGGLARSGASDGAVGVYGVGITQLIAIPLRDREADALRDQLRQSPGVQEVDAGVMEASGPLGVLVTGKEGDFGWVVAGTVTAATLVDAAADLDAHTFYFARGGVG